MCTFDLPANGQTFASVSLGDTGRAGFVHCDLPLELTRGKKRASVRFQAQPGNTAGGLFDLRMHLPERE